MDRDKPCPYTHGVLVGGKQELSSDVVSDEDVGKASFERSTNGRDRRGAGTSNKDDFDFALLDGVFEVRNLHAGKGIGEVRHHGIDAAALCVKEPVVDVDGWAVFFDTLKFFHSEDAPDDHVVVSVWRP